MTVSFVIWWYLAGLLLGLVWPIHYRKQIKRHEWKGILLRWPFYALLGPLALLATFPV